MKLKILFISLLLVTSSLIYIFTYSKNQTEWYENGNKKSEGRIDFFSNEIGKWKYWYESGRIKFLFYNDPKFNETVVLYTSWFENGQKEDEVFFTHIEEEIEEKGLLGKNIEWYENGNKKREQDIIVYKKYPITERYIYKNGLVINWYENGVKKSQGSRFDYGHKIGLWTEWYKSGKKRSEEVYEFENLLISRKEWDEDGSVKE